LKCHVAYTHKSTNEPIHTPINCQVTSGQTEKHRLLRVIISIVTSSSAVAERPHCRVC